MNKNCKLCHQTIFQPGDYVQDEAGFFYHPQCFKAHIAAINRFKDSVASQTAENLKKSKEINDNLNTVASWCGHYTLDYKNVRLDPYRILHVYGITHPAHQHAIKKLLRAGRSVKPLVQDIDEVILSLQRWKEMIKEDDENIIPGSYSDLS